jgi:hypothetical protein
VPDTLARPFVALVPAFDAAERLQVEKLAGTLLEMGCVEFCCVGAEAELLHDSLDWIIEEREAFNVATTWHVDNGEACEYFLFAAGGKLPNLLAMVASHRDLEGALEEGARRE